MQQYKEMHRFAALDQKDLQSNKVIMRDTIVALSTPFGLSAIAKIRASGTKVKQIIEKHLNKKDNISHRAFVAYYKNNTGNILDQVVAIFFSAEHSYTGEDILEIDCHGNPLIINHIIEDLQISGCRMAGPGEFTQRAYLNHKIDLCQAEAVLDVIHATNETALNIAQKQLKGSLSKKIFQFSDILLSLLAEIEANIDFTDDCSISNENIIEKFDALLSQISEIIEHHKFSKTVLNGISVAIIGHTNAGKSSLLNALIGSERAIVSDISGTTRDFISENLTIEGFLIKIIDTAGLRKTDDKIEQLGIEKTMQNIQSADICLLVIDKNNPLYIEENIINELNKKPCVVVLNKCDLPSKQYSTNAQLKSLDAIEISAKHKINIDALKSKISEIIKENKLLPDNTAIIVNSRHKEIFQTTFNLLSSAKNIFQQQSFELCSSDIRLALENIGQITGKYNTEDMLGKIFSKFCVGK